MLIVYLALATLTTISLSTADVTCDGKEVATDKFTYYTWSYRFLQGIFHWTTRKICAIGVEDRKFVCAQVAKACFPALKNHSLEEIVKEITRPPGHCKKEDFNTQKKGSEDLRGGWKKMFLCPKYTTSEGHVVTNFFVSYGGTDNTALIFDRESTKNKDIDEKPPKDDDPDNFLKLAHYVTGLVMVNPQNNNSQNKPDQNKDNPTKDTQDKQTQAKNTQHTDNHDIEMTF